MYFGEFSFIAPHCITRPFFPAKRFSHNLIKWMSAISFQYELISSYKLQLLLSFSWELYIAQIIGRFRGVMVSTQDFESCDPSSNLGGTSFETMARFCVITTTVRIGRFQCIDSTRSWLWYWSNLIVFIFSPKWVTATNNGSFKKDSGVSWLI